MKPLHAIVNPAAGSGRCGRRWRQIRRRLDEGGWRVHEHHTAARGDATRLVRRILRDGGRELLIAGGDGTANEAVNGLFEGDHPISSDAVVTIFPCGTGSDFARNLDITTSEQALQRLEHGLITEVDLGRLQWSDAGIGECRYFVNSADVGYGAETAAWVNGHCRIGGRFAYLIGGLRTIMRCSPRPATICVDGRIVHEGPLGMAVLANGRYHAGGMLFTPHASLTDGLLDVLVLDALPRWRLLADLLPRVYHGGHLDRAGVRLFRGREIEITAPRRLPFEMDGEQPGHTDLRAVVVPRALRVRMPGQR